MWKRTRGRQFVSAVFLSIKEVEKSDMIGWKIWSTCRVIFLSIHNKCRQLIVEKGTPTVYHRYLSGKDLNIRYTIDNLSYQG